MKTATKELISQSLLQSRALARGAEFVAAGAAALALASVWAQRSRVAALGKEIEWLNRLIDQSIENGVCLDGIRGIEVVIAALGPEMLAGLTMQTDAQAATGEIRAVWDPQVLRVVLRSGGEAGARYFNFNVAGGRKVAA